jgi:hypothetical protein
MKWPITTALLLAGVIAISGCSSAAPSAAPENTAVNSEAKPNAAAASTSSPVDTTIPSEVIVPETAPGHLPVLSDELTRGCLGDEDRLAIYPQEGEPAIEFTLRDVDGKIYTLSEMLAEKPVYMVFGSFT